MGTLSLLPLSAPIPLRRQRPFPPNPSYCSSFLTLRRPTWRLSRENRPLVSSNGGKSDGSHFLGEDGAVDDMDGYLNHLSLEYDSVWDTKPSWCQPWTILLTGAVLVSCSCLFFHSIVITAGIFSVISAWWYIFLYLYPKAYLDMIAERRKNVTSGAEDTYGLKKSQ